MPLGEELQVLSQRECYLSDFPEQRQKIAQAPEALDKFVLGHSHEYWTSFLDVDPSVPLVAANVPVLLAR